MDITTGDATRAYGGVLSKAIRSLIFIRPDLLLVVDDLKSDAPRTWEWNVHGVNAFEVLGPSQVKIQNAPASACLDMKSSVNMEFGQNNVFPVNPSGPHTDLWHGRFSSVSKSNAARIVTAISVGCLPLPDFDIQAVPEGLRIKARNRTFLFDGEKINPL